VILPPYNTLWAQVVRRGDPPRLVTDGLTVEYRVVDNTSSSGKTDDLGGAFAQFWQNVEALFGVALEIDTGLNLQDPAVHNGLSGQMALVDDHFEVHGVPVVPVNDAGAWNPYQVAEVTVRDAGGAIVAQTRTTIPTSDEIDCARCHGATDPLGDLMAEHDDEHETNLVGEAPVLCAACHGSPALGLPIGEAGLYLSDAIHGGHSERGATCYDCHPGERTQCSRSLRHTAEDGNCTTCHGSLSAMSESIHEGRTPWADEPACAACHEDVSQVDTGDTLYRNARGHGDLSCPACHGSPHAQTPSREAIDNYQPLAYQSTAVPLGSCRVCHPTSRGGGAEEFGEAHGGSGGEPSACRVCHTTVPADLSGAPHAFEWHSRQAP